MLFMYFDLPTITSSEDKEKEVYDSLPKSNGVYGPGKNSPLINETVSSSEYSEVCNSSGVTPSDSSVGQERLKNVTSSLRAKKRSGSAMEEWNVAKGKFLRKAECSMK